MKRECSYFVGSLLLFVACSGPVSPDCPGGEATTCTQQRGQAGRSTQGRSTQGRSTQGRSTQGRSTQGTGAAATTIDRVEIGGLVVENLALQGTVLSGSLSGEPVSGAGFVGAVVIQRDADGSLVSSTITGVEQDSRDPSQETLLYHLETPDPETGANIPFCLTDPYGGSYAIPVAGSWDESGANTDPSKITLACTAGVIAKCVRWGYKPWQSVRGQSLAPYHQACTRMARADYCGDGTSFTVDGTLIDMYDRLGIQERTPFDLSSPLFFDAAWAPQGAYCVSKERWVKLSTVTSLACKTQFVSVFPLVETSPVDSRDVCLLKRSGIARADVRLDNTSGLNVALE